MNELIEEYPKAISRLVVGVAVTFLTGKIPPEILSPEIVSSAQTIIAGITVYLVGRFTRFPKSEVAVIKEAEKEEDRNQLTK